MEFGAALQLMLPSFTLCVLMVGMLSYLGIHVIKREIIFVDLALAQIAALGALVAFLLGIPLHTQASYWFSVALTAVAAAVFTLSRSRESRVSQEAVIGLVYAIAAAAAIILIDKAPHGAEHIKDILTGSILWVKWRTVGTVAVVYAGIGLFHYLLRKPFITISEGWEKAAAAGLNIRLWDFLFYISFGLVITVSVGSAGVLLVFVFLVAPAAMAVLITDRLAYQLAFGWVLGIIATVSGLVISYVGDLSSGPLVIGAYGVALVIVSAVIYILRAPDRLRAIGNTALLAAGFAIGFGALIFAGRLLGARFGHGHPHGHAALAADEHHQEDGVADVEAPDAPPGGEGPASLADVLAAAHDAAQVEQLFESHPEAADRAAIVSRGLALDSHIGAGLALRFLATEPPLFFAQSAVDQLDSALPEPAGFDITEPFDSPVNRKAAQRVRDHFQLDQSALALPR